MEDLKQRILALKDEREAVIVAHNYQNENIQDIADVVGDSLALSKFCATTDAKVIVFCGVHFMAQTAKILSNQKKVLLPEIDAGCPMADMVTADQLKKYRQDNPDVCVVSYVNSTAEVKALSDICCTSSNAVDMVRSLHCKEILFVPDQNLGRYVAKRVPEKNIRLWEGFCIVHHKIQLKEVEEIRLRYPAAVMLVHPECQQEIVDTADFVGSTQQIIDFAKRSPADAFIIGTEMGIMHILKQQNPNKKFYLMSKGLLCVNMKKTTMTSLYNSLYYMQYDITVDEDIRVKAKMALDKMMKIG